jgi:hypothetical protein
MKSKSCLEDVYISKQSMSIVWVLSLLSLEFNSLLSFFNVLMFISKLFVSNMPFSVPCKTHSVLSVLGDLVSP